jgi:hypothetical protein
MRSAYCEYHEANAMDTDHDVILVLEGTFCAQRANARVVVYANTKLEFIRRF